MSESLAFYRDILGFEVVSESGPGEDPGWAWLRLNKETLMLNTAFDVGERPPERDPLRHTNHGDIILYFGCPDIEEARRVLTDKGLNISPPELTGYGFNALTFNDPDGYGICFHWKNEE